jgi:GTP pyrophosphokinase
MPFSSLHSHLSETNLNVAAWLESFLAQHNYKNPLLLKQAVSLAQIAGTDHPTPTGESCLVQGLKIAEILSQIHVDEETLAAAILYSSAQYTDLKPEDIAEHLGPKVSKLVQGTRRMAGISELYQVIANHHDHQKHNIDNVRYMLLAMVDDLRVVLIKLAERLYVLRQAINFEPANREQIAKETMAIYAPLASRLGITQLKWEMEDLAFSYLEPEPYAKINRFIKQGRAEREQYIQETIAIIKNLLVNVGVKDFQVMGRAKHIYSIYRKMQRKNVDDIAEIYDVSAVRILVATVEDCYAALSAVHSNWQQIKKEFDDYIANPKSNGYRSIHTAIVGPNGRNLEIQIRTYDMHRFAELGVAAHWIYKEGEIQKPGYEAKIAWLRQIMDWQKEITTSEANLGEVQQVFNDRVYVFTPAGDIVDLPKGSTALDFAYHLHSELGHRCRGAKIDGNIVTLTHTLKTGDHLEILTGKEAAPSRDWLSPNLGFLHSARARAKVFHWFKKQDYEKNIADGQTLLTAELRRHNLRDMSLNDLVQKLHFKNSDDLLAALGAGDLKINTILHVVKSSEETSNTNKITMEDNLLIKTTPIKKNKSKAAIEMPGLDNVLTNLAQCCKPIPGDPIVGYITQGRGVSIHRKDCYNAIQAAKNREEKLIQVSWGEKQQKLYPVDLMVKAYDRQGLVRDISNIVANDGIAILGLNLNTDRKERLACINFSIEISGLTSLGQILAKLRKIPSVIEVRRAK